MKRLFVTLLAEVDAMLLPHRPVSDADAWTAAAGRQERIDQYFTRGIDLRAGGDALSRKQAELNFDALASSGLLEIRRGNGRKRTGRLTPLGYAYASALVDAWQLDESWPLLTTLAEATHEQLNDGHLSELHFIGKNYCCDGVGKELAKLENKFLPLLHARLATSSSDNGRRVGYSITDAGRRALKAGTPVYELPEYEKDLGDLYDAQLSAFLAERLGWQPKYNHVVVGLSAGKWRGNAFQHCEVCACPRPSLPAAVAA